MYAQNVLAKQNQMQMVNTRLAAQLHSVELVVKDTHMYQYQANAVEIVCLMCVTTDLLNMLLDKLGLMKVKNPS